MSAAAAVAASQEAAVGEISLGAPPGPAPAALSWAEKIRAAKALPPPSAPAVIIVAPIDSAAANEAAASKNAAGTVAVDFGQLPESTKGVVVLDANAFIKGFDNFLTVADVFVTTLQVIEECKDRKTRDFLDRLPVRIEIMDPTPASIKRVLETAEKTGDAGVLSRTDLRLCALALDCALQLKALGPAVDPMSMKVNADLVEGDTSSDDDEEEEEDSDDDNWMALSDDDDEDDEEGEGNNNNNNGRTKKKTKTAAAAKKKDGDNKKKSDEGVKPRYNESLLPGWGKFDDDWGTEAQQSAKKQVAQKKEQQQKQQVQSSSLSSSATAIAPAAPAKEEAAKSAAAAAEKKDTTSSATTTTKSASVIAPQGYKGGFACVTSDFPMQNVMMHLGVPVVSSTNAQKIRELRVWVLRCHACTCIVHDTTRQFCPDCGSGDTLRRVHYVLGDNGEKHLFINFKHRLSTRGTIFNLSKPRGGRKGTNKTMVLREDQLRGAGRNKGSSMASRAQNEQGVGGVLSSLMGGGDGDGLAGFGDRDAKAGRRDGNFMMETSSYTRKNLNELRKVRASRKK